jgi:hypothetical protein
MRTLAIGLVLFSLGTVPAVVQGAAVNTITLTPAGPNTVFGIAGTFPGDIALTAYGAPNTPYTLTFAVPTAPTSFAFSDPAGVFALDTSVTLNGVTYPNSQAAFFNSDLGGGVDVCVNEFCSQDPPTVAPRFVVFTIPVELFTGTLDNPVFISGPVAVDQTQTFIESPVPEPASLSLALLGPVSWVWPSSEKEYRHIEAFDGELQRADPAVRR